MSMHALARTALRLTALVGATGLCAAPGPASAATDPAWLRLAPGTVALVDVAPWTTRRLAAALTADEDSAADMAENETQAPDDAIARPPGFAVRVQRLLDRGVVQVTGATDAGPPLAFTLAERLQPRVPAGTPLVVAGGFAGFAFLYPTLGAAQDKALQLETGTHVVAGATAVGGVRGETIDFIRVNVRIASGPLRGKTGWVAVGYTGLPHGPGYGSTPAERGCRCRILEFR